MSDNDPPRCGIGKFSTGENDPFFRACEWHDKAYTTDSWAQKNLSRRAADLHFYDQMKEAAKGSKWLLIKAAIYYRLARIFGGPYWEGKK
jgi:hypothetical protein